MRWPWRVFVSCEVVLCELSSDRRFWMAASASDDVWAISVSIYMVNERETHLLYRGLDFVLK